MQRIGTLIWAVDLGTFPVHAIANQPGCDVERITFVRPPAIQSHGEVFAVRVPITACLFFIKARQLAMVMYRATKFVGQNYAVHDDMKIIPMELIEHFFRIWENVGVPGERAILSIPARRTEPGTQVNERVTGQLLLTKRLRLGDDLFPAGQRAMGLLVTETPERRQFRISRE